MSEPAIIKQINMGNPSGPEKPTANKGTVIPNTGKLAINKAGTLKVPKNCVKKNTNDMIAIMIPTTKKGMPRNGSIHKRMMAANTYPKKVPRNGNPRRGNKNRPTPTNSNTINIGNPKYEPRVISETAKATAVIVNIIGPINLLVLYHHNNFSIWMVIYLIGKRVSPNTVHTKAIMETRPLVPNSCNMLTRNTKKNMIAPTIANADVIYYRSGK